MDQPPENDSRNQQLTIPSGSFPNGRLIMAATTLGDPADIPLRSLAALRDADLVIFEDARAGRQFLKAAGVHREFAVWSEHAEPATHDQFTATLRNRGTVVYMSDQGSPTLADPGQALVAMATQLRASITVIPGPSSIAAALSACPFPVPRFVFTGLLHRDPEERRMELAQFALTRLPLIVIDAPYRLRALLDDAASCLGDGHRAFLALDISGPRESFLSGPLEKLKAAMAAETEKINFVLITEGDPSPRASRDTSGDARGFARGKGQEPRRDRNRARRR